MENTWLSKIYRTFTSILHIDKNRIGKCINCGECCKLPNKCWFLRYKKDRTHHCLIYSIRPLNCRKYPRTEKEHTTKKTCGFRFIQDKEVKPNSSNQ